MLRRVPRPDRSLLTPIALALVLAMAASARAALTTRNVTPFPRSATIVGARWVSQRYNALNQTGDVDPVIWADDGNQYVMVNDGGAGASLGGAFWRNSMAVLSGPPGKVRFVHIGDPNNPPPHTFQENRSDPRNWSGPLGPYYSSGLVEADGIFYATQQRPWPSGQNLGFLGLAGIGYSSDRGQHWTSGDKSFSAPLGNVSFVIRGQGGSFPDGYVYAIGTEREYNASRLIVMRARPGVASMTDPAQWQWVSGWVGSGAGRFPMWSSLPELAAPVISWSDHITYPEMAYDPGINRYLLTFTYSYASTVPGMWKNGAQLVILEAPHPWGPFSFVATEANFGPSNGYAPGIPVQWISRDGLTLWLKWTANWSGCAPGLDCSGNYGFNYRQLRLAPVSGHGTRGKGHKHRHHR
jgi:hypothetical protein